MALKIFPSGISRENGRAASRKNHRHNSQSQSGNPDHDKNSSARAFFLQPKPATNSAHHNKNPPRSPTCLSLPALRHLQASLKFHSIISLPDFETTTNAIEQYVKTTIASANGALDRIGAAAKAMRGDWKPTAVVFRILLADFLKAF
jgi:hypothetical protein